MEATLRQNLDFCSAGVTVDQKIEVQKFSISLLCALLEIGKFLLMEGCGHRGLQKDVPQERPVGKLAICISFDDFECETVSNSYMGSPVEKK